MKIEERNFEGDDPEMSAFKALIKERIKSAEESQPIQVNLKEVLRQRMSKLKIVRESNSFTTKP